MGEGRHARPAGNRASRPGRYQGRRRAGRPGPAGMRVALVVLAVSAVLTGTGALARTLPVLPDLASLPELPVLPVGQPERDGRPPSGQPGSGTTGSPALPAPAATASAPPTAPGTEETAGPPDLPSPGPVADPTPSNVPTPAPTASPAPTGSPGPSSYEAETAELSGFVTIFSVPGASGGEVVGAIGQQPNNHVRFPAVNVAGAGDFQLTLWYVSVPPASAEIAVNGGPPATVDFPGLGDTSTVGSVSVEVQLAAGANEIWFGRRHGPAPALDRITVG